MSHKQKVLLVCSPYYKDITDNLIVGALNILKGLKNVGGQNPIEAVKLGCKIYHGPYVYNFKEIYEILAKKLISVQIENPSELSSNLIMDFENNIKNKNNILREIDEIGKEVLNNTMKHINNLLNNEFQ